jgi:hypothetical protein
MKISFLTVSILLACAATAQVSPAAAPVPYNSASELNQMLSQLQQTAQTVQLDLASLSIERWKTDANTKRGTAADVDSIQRNLQTALPEITNRLRSSPENLPTTFELYRNLDALYDVFTSVVESAGAFGTRDEFQSLQNDLNAMERSRRAFADRMEKLTTTKESELTELRTQLQKARAVQPAEPPKKVVVDDSDEAKPKPPVKKKIVHKKPKPPASTTQPTGNQSQSPAQNPPPKPQP